MDFKKHWKVTFLTAFIVFVYGMAADAYFNPAPSYLEKKDQDVVEAVMDTLCPDKRAEYEANLVDGKVELTYATNLLDECKAQYSQKDAFYNALVSEFSRHYE